MANKRIKKTLFSLLLQTFDPFGIGFYPRFFTIEIKKRDISAPLFIVIIQKNNYFATLSSHLTMESITNIDNPQAIAKTIQHAHNGT